jgi:hypothetical protein
VTWKDYGDEQILHNDDGQILARVNKRGCCWYAALGRDPMSSGRFRTRAEAKLVAEKLVQDSQAVVRR